MPRLLVFGARNVGRVLARELVRDGWDAAGVARMQETIAAFGAEAPDALGIVADATSPAEVERAFGETQDRFGPVDLVVNAITNGPRAASTEEVAKAIACLHEQSPRAWTHELQLTPALETWVP